MLVAAVEETTVAVRLRVNLQLVPLVALVVVVKEAQTTPLAVVPMLNL